MKKSGNQVEKTHSGVFVYAALLALALFQLGFASHQGEHGTADLNDTCPACSVYDQFDDVPPATAAVANLTLATMATVAKPAIEQSTRQPRGFRVRAPPSA